VVCLLSALLWQSFVIDLPLIPRGAPYFDLASITPVLLIAAASALFVYRRKLSRDFPDQRITHSSALENLIDIWGSRLTLLGCSGLLAIFVLNPSRFTELALEHRIVESASAALAFGSASFFLLAYFVHRRRRSVRRAQDGKLLLIASIASCLIGLEEISWFQQQLSIEASGIFTRNLQRETNIHNFATNLFDNLYYTAAFLTFVLLPFVNARTGWFRDTFLARFAPGLAPFVIIAISCGYNYDMWHGIPTQVGFWMSAFILLGCAQRADTVNLSFLLWSCLALMVLSQVIFLARGETFGRIWDVTEYKEFFITMAIFLYASEILGRMGTGNPSLSTDRRI
jgi:hypothetical protein